MVIAGRCKGDLTVTLQKLGRSQAVAGIAFAFARMRIGESDPNLSHLVLSEEMLNLVDAGTNEGHILQIFLIRLLQAAPDACALDIDTYIINILVRPCQADGVFAFATAQFEHDGIIVSSPLFIITTSDLLWSGWSLILFPIQMLFLEIMCSFRLASVSF